MNDFLKELASLIITLAVLTMATVLVIYGHVNVSDVLAIVSPVIAFWFLRGAFAYQPPQATTPQAEKNPT